ncbi:MAG: threonylcarbamoyl-AMP synthase [Desulfobacterales bacterium]|nr:MAG: threonylcarbamoyl-AMP synthase [Desulfobacterales bacterium]
MHAPTIHRIYPENPQPELVLEAAAVIRKGGVVLFPTRYLYGLGADAFNAEAVGKIFALKQRPGDKPLPVLISNTSQLDQLVKDIPPVAAKIIEHFWPGKITIVFAAKDSLPDNLTARTGKIGIRLAGHSVAAALVKHVEKPITGTSANVSGSAGCSRIEDLDFRIAQQVDLILDAGPLKGGKGSTVVDVTGDALQMIREGEISTEEILALIE